MALNLSQQVVNWGPVSFKIINIWLRDEDLRISLEGLVDRLTECKDANIHMVLKEIRNAFKEWSRQDKNKIDFKIKEVEKCINEVDNGRGQIKDLVNLNSTLDELCEQKVSMLKQKTRVNWALKSDKNTSYYHQSIQRRRCRNLDWKIYWNNT